MFAGHSTMLVRKVFETSVHLCPKFGIAVICSAILENVVDHQALFNMPILHHHSVTFPVQALERSDAHHWQGAQPC